ncbi:MAG: transcriptional repressor [Desulfocapsaceae bacterium]|nr:transcriptional repressor [Desulfocapsaceae bacterium]
MKRITSQRRAIEAVFAKHDRPLTVEEILNYGRKSVPSLNIATVYRTLKILTDNGSLVKVFHPSFGTLYERSGKDHHHHFFCRECNRAYELPGCALKVDDAAPDGFVVEDHEVFLLGKCPKCIAA